MLNRVLIGAALAAAVASGAFAQDLPKSQFKVIGLNSPTPVSIHDELPFWRKTIPEASKGAITVDITPLDQMGIDDKTMLRLLKLRRHGFRRHGHLQDGGRRPAFEACDLAGLTLDPDKARAACNAYRSVIDRQMQKNWNAKLLAFGGNTPQVFWCKDVIGGLAAFKGKKVRVFNNTMRDFLAGVGATSVGIAFAEVVPAPVGGVVDCGSPAACRRHHGLDRGHEVALRDVGRLEHRRAGGRSRRVEAARPKAQAFLIEQSEAYEDEMWATLKTTTGEADNCNTDSGRRATGELANTSSCRSSPAEAEAHKKLVEGAVLAGWAKRCGAECAEEWTTRSASRSGSRRRHP